VQPRVFRGFALTRSADHVLAGSVAYAGVVAIAWALGLVVNGWLGWVVVAAPLATWILARAWAWQRVCVEVDGGTLRYEGASPRDDFEVDLACIAQMDPSRCVLTLSDGEQRTLAELSPSTARALARHLEARPGSSDGQADGACG
jgi:hypothetical protein